MAARRADLKILLELQRVNHCPALGTFRPQALGHVFALMLASEEWLTENSHGSEVIKAAERVFRQSLASPTHPDNPDFRSPPKAIAFWDVYVFPENLTANAPKGHSKRG